MKNLRISCVRSFTIDCGHRVYGHESKCANLHGHTYRIEVHATADGLDSLGRVIDFSVIKDRIGAWLDREWDHGFIVNVSDLVVLHMLMEANSKKYMLPYNPTAENMARYLLEKSNGLMVGTDVVVHKVVVHETPNCYAEATL